MKNYAEIFERDVRFEHGEKVLRFYRSEDKWRVEIEDPEFGIYAPEVSGFLYRARKGTYTKHRRRSGNVAVGLEEAAASLKVVSPDLVLKHYVSHSKPCTLTDPEFGDFDVCTFKNALKGVQHPERRKLKARNTSKLLWQDASYAKSVKESVWDKDEAAAKRKKTMRERYGVDHALQVPSFQEKAASTNMKLYGSTSYAKTDEFVEWFKKENADKGYGKKGAEQRRLNAKAYSGKSMKEWSKELDKAYTTFQSQVKKYGFEVAIEICKKETGIEIAMRKMLEEMQVPFQPQFPVEGKVADFKVGESLLVECNGLFWHSDYIIKNKRHHFDRRRLFEAAGFRVLSFYEDEILRKPDIVKSILRHSLGASLNRLYARKCKVVDITKDLAKEFFNSNHLMGSGPCSFVSGLTYNQQLVSLMSFRRKNGNEFEIARFSNLQGIHVIGGFSKLLSDFKLRQPRKTLSTFVDLRYGTGNYLAKLGFVKVSENPSFEWVDGDRKKRLHRLKYPGNTGYDANLLKIWDSGQRRFQLDFEDV